MKSLLKKGLLIKDPTSLDQLPEVRKIFFDKTGTLTEGRLQANLNLSLLSQEHQSALYSLVSLSRHPVSRAIERAFADQKIISSLVTWDRFEEKMGVGLFAECNHHKYSIARSIESKSGFTESTFSMNGIEICRIVLQDRTREESKKIVSGLSDLGYQVAILSGDHLEPVQKLSKELKITEYYFLKNPEEKAKLVEGAMMIGDGVNDAPALSQAQVSIAVQGGMEAAIQSSQVYSLKSGISLILILVETSQLLRKSLKQNFILSTTYNIIGAILCLNGYLNPLFAAILMPASALTVFWYSLYRFKEH